MLVPRNHVRSAATSHWLHASVQHVHARLALCFHVLHIATILLGLAASFMMMRIGRGRRLAPAHSLPRVREVNARL